MGGVIGDIFEKVMDIVDDVVDIIEDIPIIGDVVEWLIGDIIPDVDYGASPTYSNVNVIGNTISEDVPIARCYGKCKIGANKLRFNDKDDSDLRIIFAHCLGEVEGITAWKVNDIAWGDLTGSHTKTEYTGTRTQTADGRFASRASAYRGMAYTAATFEKDDKQIGHDPRMTVVMEGLKCAPLAGGAAAFTRNPAVILYDWYLNVEGYDAGDLDLNAFKSLEALCDAVPSGGTSGRYYFDFNFDTNGSVNDSKKLLWSSFNGRAVMSQGKLKPVWDSAQMEDGAGGLTAKTVSHAFTEDNIVKGSLTWRRPDHYNIVRIHFLDSAKDYKKTSVEVKDEHDIEINGELLYEETCFFITFGELARRRARYKFNKLKYTDYECELAAFSGAGDLELYDLVTVTHTLPGWTAKQFLVTGKSEDIYGRMKFQLAAFYSGIYDDAEASDQEGYESDLPNPYDTPDAATGLSLALVSPGTGFDYDSVKVEFTPPDDAFYSHTEIYISNDDSTYYLAGISSGEAFVIQGMGMFYVPGDTVYIKIRSVNGLGVFGALSAAESIAITSSIRLGSFYAGLYDFWGGNAAIDNAATVMVMGNLDGTPKIALGASADAITVAGTEPGFIVDGGGNLRIGGDTHGLKFDAGTGVLSVSDKVRVGSGTYIDIDGGNARIRSSNYVSGIAGAGFTLEPDLLEVGNIAARGIIRTAVFQKDVVSAVGGNLAVLPADVLDADMTAADSATLTIEGNETFAVGDLLRIKDGTDDEWLEVTNAGSAPTYTVTRDKGAAYGADANPAWTKGATVVNYGQSGDGFVYMTASETNAPYMSVVTHAGSPWDTLTTRLRMGNLNGFLGYDSDLYGIAIGEADAYLKYDPTNGMRIKGGVMITGGSLDAQNLLNNPGFENGSTCWSEFDGLTYETSGGDNSNYCIKMLPGSGYNWQRDFAGDQRYFEVNAGDIIEYGGSIKSGDGTTKARISIHWYDKDKSGGGWDEQITTTQTDWQQQKAFFEVPATGKFISLMCYAQTESDYGYMDNVFLRLAGTEDLRHSSDITKIDGGNIYTNTITATQIAANTITASEIAASTITASQLKGTDFGTLEITSGKIQINTTDALEIKSSGNVKVLAGGDIELIGDDSDPGVILFTGSSYEVSMGFTSSGDKFSITPDTDDAVQLDIGEGWLATDIRWKKIFLKAISNTAMGTDDGSNHKGTITTESESDRGEVTFFAQASSDITGRLYFTVKDNDAKWFYPNSTKEIDLGGASYAWDDAYADDWHNVADLYFLDEIDDLASLSGIGKGTETDPRNGLPLIDDDTLPEWMLTRSKNGREILRDPEGKPWLSNKVLFSTIIGAIKQLNQKIEALQ